MLCSPGIGALIEGNVENKVVTKDFLDWILCPMDIRSTHTSLLQVSSCIMIFNKILRITEHPARADQSAIIRINLRTSPSVSVGARVVDVGRGGPSWSPASCSADSFPGKHDSTPTPGDHKGPPNPSSSALAPTDHPAPAWLSGLG